MQYLYFEIYLPFPFGSLGRAAGIALARLRSANLTPLEMTVTFSLARMTFSVDNKFLKNSLRGGKGVLKYSHTGRLFFAAPESQTRGTCGAVASPALPRR